MLMNAVSGLTEGFRKIGRAIEAIPFLGDATRALGGVSADGHALSNGQRALAGAGAMVDLAAGAGEGRLAREVHHLLAQQFRAFFGRAGLDIEKFTVEVTRGQHRLTPGGVHTTAGGNWNRVWRDWIGENPSAGRDQVLEQLNRMKQQFNIQ
jgi:hypothetical protein